MGKYCIIMDPSADLAVQEVIDKVISTILRVLGKEVQAIVLTGGYGRGEGGVYSRGDEYYLVNDLDLVICVQRRSKKMKSLLEVIENDIKSLLPSLRGIKQVDISLTEQKNWIILF